MIFFSRRSGTTFRQGAFREAAGDVQNPGRGWYHIYTYDLKEGTGCDLPPVFCEGESLALVRIDIGGYREQDLDREGLALLDRILGSFAEGGREMILRIVYDTEGKGMEHEPSLFSQVRRHMEQLAPLLLRYSQSIFVYQGLLVGSWGELHTSKFVSEKYLRQLWDAFCTLTEGRLRTALRKPVQCRLVQRCEGTVERGIGGFDDAIFASQTHMGTFGTRERREAGWGEPWRREDEIPFMEQLAQSVPFGGEALSGEKDMKAEDTVERLGRLHVSYLNCVHEEERLAQWRETEYAPGVSLYDYIGAHLGYRFVVEKVSCERKGRAGSLAVKIANRGFACCGEDLQFVLCLRQKEGERLIIRDCGLGELESGRSMTLQLPLEERREGLSLYGKLRRARDHREIRFANQGADPRGLLLGSFD